MLLAISPLHPDELNLVLDVDQPRATAVSLPALSRHGIVPRRRDCEVHNTEKEFRIRLELHHYKPNEVTITADQKYVTVTAKHEEREDNHGFVSRKITRSYKLPEDIDLKSLKSSMNSQGVLCIRGKKKEESNKEIPVRVEYRNNRDW